MIVYILENGKTGFDKDGEFNKLVYNKHAYHINEFYHGTYITVKGEDLYFVGCVEHHAGNDIWMYADIVEDYDILKAQIAGILDGTEPHTAIAYGCYNGHPFYQDSEGFKLNEMQNGEVIVKSSLDEIKTYIETLV